MYLIYLLQYTLFLQAHFFSISIIPNILKIFSFLLLTYIYKETIYFKYFLFNLYMQDNKYLTLLFITIFSVYLKENKTDNSNNKKEKMKKEIKMEIQDNIYK